MTSGRRDLPSNIVGLADELRRQMDADPNFASWYPTYQALFSPFEDLPHRLRQGDASAIEPALMFLEADPWCFRSGYMKESLTRALSSGVNLSAYRERVHRIVLRRLDDPQPGLRKPTMSLAAAVWDPDLDAKVKTRAVSPDPAVAERARDLKVGVERRRALDT